MAPKKRITAKALLALADWDAYLMADNSGLRGPRGNLELAQVAADEAQPARRSTTGWRLMPKRRRSIRRASSSRSARSGLVWES